MKRIIKPMSAPYMKASLDFFERVFTEAENAREGKMVRRLAEEIRAKAYYIPELDLIMVNELDEIIGHVMFSRFHIEGRYADELLILTPVAVRSDLQRRHISKELIEYGLNRAREMGYKAVLVEGNPDNYRARGFVTAADYGIYASEKIHLPRVECLMVCELAPGALEQIHGVVDYDDYEALS